MKFDKRFLALLTAILLSLSLTACLVPKEEDGQVRHGGTKGPLALPWEPVVCSDLLSLSLIPGRPGGPFLCDKASALHGD